MAAAYNGVINLEEWENDLPIEYVVSNYDVTITSAGNITDSRDGETGNVYGKNITLESINGTIGTSGEDLNIDVNYQSSGGALTAITDDALINVEQWENSLLIDSVSAGTGDVVITSAGGILDNEDDLSSPTVNITGANITLEAGGLIGYSEDIMKDRYLEVNTGELSLLKAKTTNNSDIHLKEMDGDLRLYSAYQEPGIDAGTGTVFLSAPDGGVFTQNNDYPNIKGSDIHIYSYAGSVGTNIGYNDIDIDLQDGALFIYAANYDVNINELSGDLSIESVMAGTGDVYISSAGGILDSEDDLSSPTVNITGANITLEAGGLIGYSENINEDRYLEVNTGELSLLKAKTTNNSDIHLKEMDGDLRLYSAYQETWY